MKNLQHDFDSQYLQVEVDDALITSAIELAKRHKLRGAEEAEIMETIFERKMELGRQEGLEKGR